MVLHRLCPLAEIEDPLRLEEWPDPEPRAGEVRVRVLVCGVCHTELDEIEGRLPPAFLPIILGHQIVGIVDRLGPRATRWREGDRVGIGWIHDSDGTPQENLSPCFRATGRDVCGGYAEYVTIPQDYAYPIPEVFSDEEAAPLLCAGAIGYRALRLARLHDGQSLGLMGFGASSHLVLQVARYLYPESPIFVFARDAEARLFAQELGADWVGGIDDRPPQALQAMIDTTPAWRPLVQSLTYLRPGGRLVVNAIRKEAHDKQALLGLEYHEHLWLEREVKSVANITQFDLREFLPLAAAIPLRVTTTVFPIEQANQALVQLQRQATRGAKVLRV